MGRSIDRSIEAVGALDGWMDGQSGGAVSDTGKKRKQRRLAEFYEEGGAMGHFMS